MISLGQEPGKEMINNNSPRRHEAASCDVQHVMHNNKYVLSLT